MLTEEKILQEIVDFPIAKLKRSRIPYSIYVLEASEFISCAKEDATKLQPFTISCSMLKRTGMLVACLQQQIRQYERVKRDVKELRREWEHRYEEGKKHLAYLRDTYRFAYARTPSVLKLVQHLTGRKPIPQTISQLATAYSIGINYPTELENIQLSAAEVVLAHTMAHDLADLNAKVSNTSLRIQEAKYLRDAAYTILKIEVDMICDAAKLAFRDNPERRRCYTSKYKRQQNQKRRKG